MAGVSLSGFRMQDSLREVDTKELKTNESILSQRRDPDIYPALYLLEGSLRLTRLYRDWNFGRYTPPRLPQPADLPNRVLLPDGQNLGLILNQIRKVPEAKEALMKNLSAVYDGVRDVDIRVPPRCSGSTRTPSPSGSREDAVLLVNAEAPVDPEKTTWEHLTRLDSWDPPAGATEDNTHVMVQCMESWFLADPETLAGYFGQGFQASALPKNPNIEEIAKPAVLRSLEAATRQTKTKGAYSKGGHSFAILALIDPNKVRRASPYAERLAVTVLRFSS